MPSHKWVTADCLPALQREKRPVVILALMPLAETILRACREHGINVAAFCDSRAEKARAPHAGLPVIQTQLLREHFDDACFLLVTPDFDDAASQLHTLGYTEIYSAATLLRDFDPGQYESEKSTDFLRFHIDTYLRSHDNHFNPERVYLKNVDVVITERCSLKCRDCANLMQYYQNPREQAAEALLLGLERLHQATDEITELRIIGGEPFMRRDWLDVTKQMLGMKIARTLVFFTNGTIVPDDSQLCELSGENVVFSITDYGALSRNCNDLVAKLEKHGLCYNRITADKWVDCSRIIVHDRTRAQLRDVYKQCCAKNLYTLINGRLYRCPFSANLCSLGAIADAEGDFVGLLDIKAERPEALRNELKKLIRNTTFLKSCDYCVGRPYDAPLSLDAAIQVKRPLPYAKCSE